MRIFYALAASIVLGCYVPVALAADASVTISSPQEGAKISPKTEVNVTYAIVLGPNGNHAHLYVDNGEPVILRALKGSHSVGTLVPGKHQICLKEVNKAHTPTGAQACVNVSTE